MSILVLLYFDGDERAGCILLLTVNAMRLLVVRVFSQGCRRLYCGISWPYLLVDTIETLLKWNLNGVLLEDQ